MTKAAGSFGIIGSVLLLGASFLPSPASAADAKWGAASYKYLIVDQDIRDVLVEFGRNANVPTQIAPTVGARRIRGPLASTKGGTAQDFLQRFCDSYGLVWYFDGTVLHIAALEDIQTEVITLDKAKTGDILRRLGELGMTDARFALRAADNGGMLWVSGPPAYRSQIRKTVSIIEASGKQRTAREVDLKDAVEVRVFRGGW
ncbi:MULTISPECIES: type III secretion protein [Rhodomicrobium]|uniref:type III secretion protein n=1 Tax=Rhodomicrobium TaxID=1068 RepID=UPI000B4AB369|nr:MULTISPECIES: type III secretion protein [Rhodomicrobium]